MVLGITGFGFRSGSVSAPTHACTSPNVISYGSLSPSPDFLNVSGQGVIVVLDMTTVGTGSVTLTIQGKDRASGKYFWGKYYTLLAGAAVTTNSTNVYTLFPGAAATANVSANAQLPDTWRILISANNANPTTYTVGASVLAA